MEASKEGNIGTQFVDEFVATYMACIKMSRIPAEEKALAAIHTRFLDCMGQAGYVEATTDFPADAREVLASRMSGTLDKLKNFHEIMVAHRGSTPTAPDLQQVSQEPQDVLLGSLTRELQRLNQFKNTDLPVDVVEATLGRSYATTTELFRSLYDQACKTNSVDGFNVGPSSRFIPN